VSTTVTVNEHIGPALVQVTVVVPTGKKEPDIGEQVAWQLGSVIGGWYVTTAPHWPGSFDLVMLLGQMKSDSEAPISTVPFMTLGKPAPR
jgi:hypothetical protein